MACNCDGHCDTSKATYYYIEFVGLTEQEIDTSAMFGGQEDGEEWKKGSEKNPFGLGQKIKIPSGDFFSEVFMSSTGLFIPSEIHDYLKTTHKIDKVQITLVRDLNKDEYEAEIQYKTMKKSMMNIANDLLKDTAEKKVVLPSSVKSELDDLFEMTEKGKLRVIAPDADEPEIDLPKTRDDLENGDFGDFRFDDE